MPDLAQVFVYSFLSYLIGSVPFSYLIAKAKGIDPRSVGSGNVGATNVARSVGFVYGFLALLLDVSKGFAAAQLVIYTVKPIWISGFAVAGHNWSFLLGFKAGKGVATTLGVLLAISWQTFLVTLAVWAVFALITRYVSLASVMALVICPVILWLLAGLSEAVWLMLALGLISVFQHRENFRRLLAGTEGKI